MFVYSLRAQVRVCNSIMVKAILWLYLRFEAFCVQIRISLRIKKNAKKCVKICIYKKNVVILHRGIVRA